MFSRVWFAGFSVGAVPVAYPRTVCGFLLALLVSGCVTASNSLPREQAAALRLSAVNVSFAPGARISWGDGERAYASTKGAPDQSDALANTPEGQAYVRNAIGSKVKTAMERHLGGRLKGTRLVRVEVNVTEVQIASVAQRILVGGNHSMKGDVALVDAKTGEVLVAYPAQSAVGMAGQGIAGTLIDQAVAPNPIDRIVDSYAAQYGHWLLPLDPNGPI
jgi:hypothetical protein